MTGLTLRDCDGIIFVAVTENEAICSRILLKYPDYTREGVWGTAPRGRVAPLRALRRSDHSSMWIWHGDRLNHRDTAHQVQAVPAVGLG